MGVKRRRDWMCAAGVVRMVRNSGFYELGIISEEERHGSVVAGVMLLVKYSEAADCVFISAAGGFDAQFIDGARAPGCLGRSGQGRSQNLGR